jgi:hypothetical protein
MPLPLRAQFAASHAILAYLAARCHHVWLYTLHPRNHGAQKPESRLVALSSVRRALVLPPAISPSIAHLDRARPFNLGVVSLLQRSCLWTGHGSLSPVQCLLVSLPATRPLLTSNPHCPSPATAPTTPTLPTTRPMPRMEATVIHAG